MGTGETSTLMVSRKPVRFVEELSKSTRNTRFSYPAIGRKASGSASSMQPQCLSVKELEGNASQR